MESPFFERFKVSLEPWPWQDNKEWPAFITESLTYVAFNKFVMLPAMLLFAGVTNKWVPVNDISIEEFPTGYEMLWQIVFSFVIEDFFFHLGHRLMHTRYFYSKYHKIHHKYNISISIASESMHAFEYVFTGIIPSSIGMVVLGRRVHYITHLAWIYARISETTNGHSGYDFPWSVYALLPNATTTPYHDYHHSHNIGNYSSIFKIWDSVFGLNKSWFKHIENKEKQKK
jgi:sterol desaturase/sphingolipid hydroxylase (fatty acid hydroxylase superfamily)